jgi:cation-transporting P-type ATPase 13A2
MYSLTNFTSVLLLYTIGYNLADSEFLYIDMGLILFIAFFFSQTDSFPVLDLKAPTHKLIGWRPILSLAFHTLLTFSIQYFAFLFVQKQPWYEKFYEEVYGQGYLGPYENSSVFIVSLFQYNTAGLIFSVGMPYRKAIYSNKPLFIFLLLSTLMNIFLGLNEFKFVTKVIVMRIIPDLKFRFLIILIAVIHFLIAFLFETFLFQDIFI